MSLKRKAVSFYETLNSQVSAHLFEERHRRRLDDVEKEEENYDYDYRRSSSGYPHSSPAEFDRTTADYNDHRRESFGQMSSIDSIEGRNRDRGFDRREPDDRLEEEPPRRLYERRSSEDRSEDRSIHDWQRVDDDSLDQRLEMFKDSSPYQRMFYPKLRRSGEYHSW